MLEELIQKIRQGDVQSFEDFYILTYDTLYSYAWILTGAQREKAQEMLVRTYCKVYGMRENIPEESQVYEWLYQTMDQTAIDWLEMTEEQIQDITKEEENHETVVQLSEETAASVLLSIEDLLGLLEEREEVFDRKKKIISFFKFAFACGCLAVAVFAVCNGIEKLRGQFDILSQPWIRTLQSVEGTYDDNGNLVPDAEEEQEENWVKVGDKIYFLSDIGQVRDFLPLEESDLVDKTPYNDEIQETENWVYYLPCPERADSKLSNVSSRLIHTLYRIKKQDQLVELVSEEVQDFAIYNGAIYVMQYNRIHILEEAAKYETLENNLFAEVRDDGIYLFNVLGTPLQTSSEGTLQIEDRIYKMKGSRIESVSAAECKQGETTWYLKTEGNKKRPELFQATAGQESVFESQGIRIDSFCKAGDWIYYSAYMRDGDSGVYYSEVYRKPLSGGNAEMVCEEFSGNLLAMYYSEENNTIYAEYYPRSWESGYGEIAVITADGKMSTLNTPTVRNEEETTGSDNLSFVIIQDQDVLCYWNNCSWIRGEEPFVIWSKPMIVSNYSRTPVPEVIHQIPQ